MTQNRPRRVMWLLNHGAARKFEIPMLKRAGFNEIFLPKIYPDDPSFRSASVDFSEDENLTIDSADLAVLNATDWYGEPSKQAWAIANKHFDILFFILHYPEFISSVTRHFEGVMIWRTYGREIGLNYDGALRAVTRDHGPRDLRSIGDRFFFGMAYDHLHLVEPEYIRRRAVYLPLGLHDVTISDHWDGSDNRMLFVCPDIEANQYYTEVYENFRKGFGDLPHVVGGVQSIQSTRPNVLGYLTQDAYERNMRQLRVMYYHSLEPNHIHYHPFEAVKAGMPLIYRAGGLLDRLGGVALPGRAKSTREARRLIERLQTGDSRLSHDIRASQSVLLDQMTPDYCVPFWQHGMAAIVNVVDTNRALPVMPKRYRVAVLLPLAYRGGSFNAAKLVIEALHFGAEASGAKLDIVFGYPDDADYSPEDFADLPKGVVRRPFYWRKCGMDEARRAMILAGEATWQPSAEKFVIAEDGVNNFFDADIWLVISDRLTEPLLPLRPIVSLVYDYVQRYHKLWGKDRTLGFLFNTWTNQQVLVTTDFTRGDAIQYGGLPPARVTKIPIVIRRPKARKSVELASVRASFVWATNASPHKNHRMAIDALTIYYEEFAGKLACVITGVDSGELLKGRREHLEGIAAPLQRLITAKKVRLKGMLSDAGFAAELERAAFLWHPADVDNGTFSVVEAAYLGIPSLSSDYPAMKEMNVELDLGLSFSPSDSPRTMAERLKWMEENSEAKRQDLPTPEDLDQHSPTGVGVAYWQELAKHI